MRLPLPFSLCLSRLAVWQDCGQVGVQVCPLIQNDRWPLSRLPRDSGLAGLPAVPQADKGRAKPGAQELWLRRGQCLQCIVKWFVYEKSIPGVHHIYHVCCHLSVDRQKTFSRQERLASGEKGRHQTRSSRFKTQLINLKGSGITFKIYIQSSMVVSKPKKTEQMSLKWSCGESLIRKIFSPMFIHYFYSFCHSEYIVLIVLLYICIHIIYYSYDLALWWWQIRLRVYYNHKLNKSKPI